MSSETEQGRAELIDELLYEYEQHFRTWQIFGQQVMEAN